MGGAGAGPPLTFSACVNMILLHTGGAVVAITMARSRGSGMNSRAWNAREMSGWAA